MPKPILRTRPAVPIAQIGVWQTSTGTWKCTAEQLRSAVEAQHDPAFRNGVIKLGHSDPRFTDGEQNGDGEPAVGRLSDLRLSADGQQLLADLIGLPAWLDEVVEIAYPSRSIEALLDVETQDGRAYPMVVTGLALLGVQAPAIESLGDLADLFGVSRDVEDYVAARRVAASALPLEDPMPRALGQVVDRSPRAVTASASIEELSSAAETWAVTQPEMGRDCWVRDIYTDTVIFSSWRDDDVCFYRATWSETNGTFTFGGLERVRPTYEPVPSDAGTDQMMASRVPEMTHGVGQRVHRPGSIAALSFARGRVVTAGGPKEQMVPISPALAAALGVAEDSDDETVMAALEKLRTPPTPTPVEQQSQQEGGNTLAPADIETLVAAAVAKATAPVLASLETTSTELAAMKAEKATDVRDGVIGAAISAGKIKPADRAQWETDYAGAPEVITSVLAKLAPGTAVPVTASGHTGGEQDGSDDALYAQLYGTQKAGV